MEAEPKSMRVTLGSGDPDGLAVYARLLDEAYANGAARGGSMHWADVDLAYDRAVEAFGPAGAGFAAAAHAVQHDEDVGFEDIEIHFPVGHDPTPLELSAAKLLAAYVHGGAVDWSAVDEAWQIAKAPPPAAPSR